MFEDLGCVFVLPFRGASNIRIQAEGWISQLDAPLFLQRVFFSRVETASNIGMNISVGCPHFNLNGNPAPSPFCLRLSSNPLQYSILQIFPRGQSGKIASFISNCETQQSAFHNALHWDLSSLKRCSKTVETVVELQTQLTFNLKVKTYCVIVLLKTF